MAVETRRASLVESERPIQVAAGGGALLDDFNPLANAYKAGDLLAGKYRLVRMIGRGGMGVVWEAHSDALDIRVAVKLIHQFTASHEEQQRLLLEAKAAARLVDPGVVRVFDCGETLNGEPYIVMELLEGEDLATRLDQRGRLQPIDAVRTLLPIVRALGTAHAANVVHRDVKPENVFFTKSANGEEQPKLLDFGIAKMDIPWEKRLTQVGAALGSPNYMSPEQARGEEVDGRCDLWGLCVVLYEAIAGELPFDGNSYNAVMHAILSARVAPFPELGIEESELWAIVERGLERELSLRWQTSEELTDALTAWLIDRGVTDDVTGFSLRATRTKKRASHVRTLESVRPVKADRKVSPSASAALANTGPRRSASRHRLWSRRPRWFVPSVFALAFFGVVVLVWRIQMQARGDEAVPSAVPVQPAIVAEQVPPSPVSRPAPPSPGVEPVAASAATAAVVSASRTAVLAKGNAAAESASRKPAPKASAKESAPKAPSGPKSEPFKSPFD
jgi:eukaryotic-like serine/threonine-protein kinase